MASLAEKRMEDAEDHPVDQNTDQAARPEELRLLEALLFASAEPIDQAALAKRMPDGVDIKAALAQLQAEYAPRGVNLVRVANKWTFRTAGDLSWLMTRESTETRKLSRAAIEVLAIVAYHQPVTRAEIEEIRGVVTSKRTLPPRWTRPNLTRPNLTLKSRTSASTTRAMTTAPRRRANSPEYSRLSLAILRSRDSDLPRPRSLFLTPRRPNFRQSSGRSAGHFWRVAGWVRLAFGTGSS